MTRMRRRFTCDKYGLLTGLDKSFTDGKSGGQQIAYAYDQYDRLKNIDFGDNRSQALKHDRRGKTTSVDAIDGATVKHMELEYTQFDQLAAKTVTETKAGKTVSALKYEYTYNAAGKRTGLVVNMGAGTRELSWNYDELGRLTEQKDGSKVVTYRYNNKSQLVEQNIGGIPVYYTYTALGQLESKVMGALPAEGGTNAPRRTGPIASLKYEYAKDGQIVARTVSGVRQTYEYDAKGQLLSVKDSTGIVEAYVYDAAENILKKTINGKTTTFEYDSANQLTKATLPDGTVKDYAYDAAGRMVKDGNKTLSYGWFNKVMNISENGKTVADYDYTVDGQLSKSNVNGKEETFVWDDLALIQRNSTELTNEPYVTGGNPIMANDKALFNDMLGSTLGVAANGSYSPINRTSFGEVDNASSSEYNFFTGKPNVEGLGYSFLFRNYNANNGKWRSQDPLGYPDGWNNTAYCNNQITNCFDWLGNVSQSITRATNDTYTVYDNGSIKVNSSTYSVVVTFTNLPQNYLATYSKVTVVHYYYGLTRSTNKWYLVTSSISHSPASCHGETASIGTDIKQLYIKSVYTIESWYATSMNSDGTYNWAYYIGAVTDTTSQYGKLIE